jgi:hypothetical protein
MEIFSLKMLALGRLVIQPIQDDFRPARCFPNKFNPDK